MRLCIQDEAGHIRGAMNCATTNGYHLSEPGFSGLVDFQDWRLINQSVIHKINANPSIEM